MGYKGFLLNNPSFKAEIDPAFVKKVFKAGKIREGVRS